MSVNKVTLKAALLDFLKTENNKLPAITLDCNWSHNLKVSDHKNYFFVSKSLKKKLKDDDKVPQDKNFKITLSKWNFVVEGTKKGVKEVDIDVKKYSIKAVKEDLNFAKRTKDLLEYPDVKSKLEAESKVVEKKDSIKKTKAKVNEKVKQLKAEPKTSKKEEKEVPVKKKITKTASKTINQTKNLKSKESANKIEDNHNDKKVNRKSNKESSITAEIHYVDIIRARDFDGTDNKRSTTKILRFQNGDGQISRVASPHQVNQESLHRLSSALGRAVTQQLNFENTLPETLKDKSLSYRDFLVGRDHGLVSAKEIVFNRNAIDMFFKEYKDKELDAYD